MLPAFLFMMLSHVILTMKAMIIPVLQRKKLRLSGVTLFAQVVPFEDVHHYM